MDEKFIEVSGRNVEEALTNAVTKLATPSDRIIYEVIEKGSNGVLGIGKKPAIIKARVKTDEELLADIKEEQMKARLEEQEKLAEKAKTAVEANTASEARVETPKTEVKSEAKIEAKAEKKAEPKTEVKAEAKAEAKADAKASDNSLREDDEKNEKYTSVLSHEEIEKRVEDFLDGVFAAMNMQVEIKFDFSDPECVDIDLLGDNMGVLIGKRGQTLDSLQYLTSLVVNKGKNKYVRIKLDTEDYRKRRKETLENLAKNLAYKVKRSRRSVSLEPMNPYERRIIHSALQNDRFVSTRSEGEEPFRHVIVFIDKDKNQDRASDRNSDRKQNRAE